MKILADFQICISVPIKCKAKHEAAVKNKTENPSVFKANPNISSIYQIGRSMKITSVSGD